METFTWDYEKEIQSLRETVDAGISREVSLMAEILGLRAIYCEVHHGEPTKEQPCPCCAAVEVADLRAQIAGMKREWRQMATAPRDGTAILVAFRRLGVVTVSWVKPDNASPEIWCVEDFKFGPYALRGYSDDGVLGWMPLPPVPDRLVSDWADEPEGKEQ